MPNKRRNKTPITFGLASSIFAFAGYGAALSAGATALYLLQGVYPMMAYIIANLIFIYQFFIRETS